MTQGAKIMLSILCVVIVLLVTVTSAYVYLSYHPMIGFSGSRTNIMIGFSDVVPMASSIKNELSKCGDWVDVNANKLMEFEAKGQTYDIKPYGELSDGVVKLWYKGVVTDADGNTTDYYSEGTFKLPVKAKNFRLSSE